MSSAFLTGKSLAFPIGTVIAMPTSVEEFQAMLKGHGMNKTDLTIHTTDEVDDRALASDSAVCERGKLIVLMHNLETALAAASFNRIDDWRAFVVEELQELQHALRDSRVEINSSDGLFAEIAAESPRLISTIENLKCEYWDLERQIVTLRDQFQKSDPTPEVGDIRERLGWLLKALRHAQAKENELVFEAIGRDLGGGG